MWIEKIPLPYCLLHFALVLLLLSVTVPICSVSSANFPIFYFFFLGLFEIMQKDTSQDLEALRLMPSSEPLVTSFLSSHYLS